MAELPRVPMRPWAMILLVGVMVGACRLHPETASPVPASSVWPKDEYCWWTAVSTTLPVDSVASRFARAYSTLGLGSVVSSRVGDTVLVRAGPTALAATLPGRYASRMVAFQHGDSTRFRWYWSIVPLADQLMTDSASTPMGGRGIGFCGEIGKIVAIHGWGPRGPSGADSIAVWQRRP
jgi:hypothetical protein